jgi:hypothetical protein
MIPLVYGGGRILYDGAKTSLFYAGVGAAYGSYTGLALSISKQKKNSSDRFTDIIKKNPVALIDSGISGTILGTITGGIAAYRIDSKIYTVTTTLNFLKTLRNEPETIKKILINTFNPKKIWSNLTTQTAIKRIFTPNMLLSNGVFFITPYIAALSMTHGTSLATGQTTDIEQS